MPRIVSLKLEAMLTSSGGSVNSSRASSSRRPAMVRATTNAVAPPTSRAVRPAMCTIVRPVTERSISTYTMVGRTRATLIITPGSSAGSGIDTANANRAGQRQLCGCRAMRNTATCSHGAMTAVAPKMTLLEKRPSVSGWNM